MSHPLEVDRASPTGGETVEDRQDILDEVSRVIAALESHPDREVRENLEVLLGGIDAVHRVALTHLFNAVKSMGGDAFINKLTTDPAIRILLMSYDLLAVDRRLTAEEALDEVRGHLHAHGIDVELLDVAGSEVFVRLHGLDGSPLTEEAVRRDIEYALKEGLIGFQILVIGDRKQQKPADFIQLGGLRRAQRPVYRTVLTAGELPPGDMKSVDVDGDSILIANIEDGGVFAVANHCGESPLPLEYSVLSGAVLVCSWHGCRYDLRTGARVDGKGDDRLRVYPVRVSAGEIQVAVTVEPVPRDVASETPAAALGEKHG
jgi:nitrite reductase/ring-hydroxylating ferredoxin subunit/Fe-S cluster biogenesis protein NfuA